ncbi:MAG: hypothetical protein V4610_16770 [Pseudomonadota bacterium]|uniref:Uncharacterized protein n=1 Tax=hydrothermal vent metagenome TaxID=652676 RepID=A0A160TQ09_9ZZZZ
MKQQVEAPVTTSQIDAPTIDAPVWHRPEITRVSLKETMYFSGSPIDGGTEGNITPV